MGKKKLLYIVRYTYTTKLNRKHTNRWRMHTELRYEIIMGKYLQVQAHCPSLNRLPCAPARLKPGPRALIASTLPTKQLFACHCLWLWLGVVIITVCCFSTCLSLGWIRLCAVLYFH